MSSVTRVGEAGAARRRWRSTPRADATLREPLIALGRRVADRRAAADPPLTQEALAAKASLGARHIQDVEHGRSNVTLATLRAIATGLDTTVAELLAGIC